MRLALLAADGARLELPEAMHDVLRQVADALASGMGVTVAPMNAMLTTQEAADFLGVARPTLVRILERGEIPIEKPGRHRFVRLQDLVAYQAAQRALERCCARRFRTRGGGRATCRESAEPADRISWLCTCE